MTTTRNVLASTERQVEVDDARRLRTAEAVAGELVQSCGLDCLELGGDVATDDVQMTLTFYPTSYAPAGLVVPFP